MTNLRPRPQGRRRVKHSQSGNRLSGRVINLTRTSCLSYFLWYLPYTTINIRICPAFPRERRGAETSSGDSVRPHRELGPIRRPASPDAGLRQALTGSLGTFGERGRGHRFGGDREWGLRASTAGTTPSGGGSEVPARQPTTPLDPSGTGTETVASAAAEAAARPSGRTGPGNRPRAEVGKRFTRRSGIGVSQCLRAKGAEPTGPRSHRQRTERPRTIQPGKHPRMCARFAPNARLPLLGAAGGG
jgi:hypothetical protein